MLRTSFLLLFMCVHVLSAAQETAKAKHVVLVSVDGFRADFYLQEKWPAPYIKEMAQEGVHALGVRGIFPSVTYPSHTTLVTGALPKHHGIYYNSPFEPEGYSGRWYWENSWIQTETLWDAVKKADMTSAAFFWPVTVGAPIDYNVPEVWSLEKGYGLLGKTREHQTPKGFIEELEREVTGQLNSKTFSGDYLNREDRTGEMAAYTLETYKPNFMAVHLIATDHFQHDEGKNGPTIPKALAATDRAIGKIIEAATRAEILDDTVIIVTGDHGFVDVHSALSPNVWLVEAGLMEDKRDRGDWKATFHTTGASAFLILKNPKDRKTLRKVREKLASIPDNMKKLFRIVERDELDRIGADPNAALALAPVPGVDISWSSRGPVLKPKSGGTHGFFPDFKAIETGFVVWGSAVAENKMIEHMGLEDIAPLISQLLGLDFTAKDGILYPGILRKD
ncbi:alkaline phosphatase family protein [Marinicella sp. W31]|uniref:alkaline phosphatase family protein n=1 Tax=Marinicella sp. W31 TaxID=3023713 RepID=UPI003757275D